jgi:hypothetical protein
MSDYLWDRKGEPDAEVARLEALLGTFRHEPRPLELPAEAATPEPATARLLTFSPRARASRLFAPAALAAAAALVVAAVLVASAFLRARVPDEGARRDERTQQPAEVVRRMLEPPPGAVREEKPRAEVKVKEEKAAVGTLTRVAQRRKDSRPAVSLRQRPKVLNAETARDGAGAGQALTFEAMRAGNGASALVESTRLLTKEQLVYALRLTGAKLKDVREKAQGADESRPR